MSTRSIAHEREHRLIHMLFFLFGFGVMAWVPRFPELRENLALGNGAFGSLMSTGSIGAFFGLLTVGHIIHKFGAERVSIAAFILLFVTLFSLVHITNSLIFLILNIAFGFGITSVHVSLTSQALHFNDRSGQNIVISTSGYWSAGALTAAISSGLLVDRISLKTHISILAVVVALIMISIIFKLRPVLLESGVGQDSDYTIKEIFTSFKIDWPVSLGMACAVYLEFAVGDWGTIFTKDRLGMSAGLSTIPFIVFMTMMILGRLLIHKLLKFAPIYVWARRGALLAGIVFGLSIIIATHLPSSYKWWSYSLFLLGFLSAGLGSSFIAPSFFTAASRRSKLPNAIVVGQFGVVNNVLIFIVKWIVAWTMQFTGSIALAMMIPTLMVLLSILFVGTLKEDSQAKA